MAGGVKYLWVLVVIAMLVMAGGRVAHASMEILIQSVGGCAGEEHQGHAEHSGHSHSGSEHENCPQNHCCHFHACPSLFRVETGGISAPVFVSGELFVADKAIPESLVLEIERPPQLF